MQSRDTCRRSLLRRALVSRPRDLLGLVGRRAATRSTMRQGAASCRRGSTHSDATVPRMRISTRTWLLSFWIATLAVVLLPATSSGNTGHSCGQISGGTFASGRAIDPFTQYSYRVYADGVRCQVARRVGHAWGKATHVDGGAPLNATVDGFACSRTSYEQKSPAASCSRGSATITLDNAPLAPTIMNFAKYEIRPTYIAQGASNELYKLRWHSWGGRMATASGRGSYGVTEHYHTYRLSLSAFHIGSCRGIRVYTHLRLHDLSQGGTAEETLECRTGQYFGVTNFG
jgi:hypothetical protein